MKKNRYRAAGRWLTLALVLLSGARAAAFDLAYVTASPAVYSEPHNLAISPDRRYLYVADNGNDRVAVLDPDSLRQVGSFGEGELGAPHDVAFDAAGRLLVADTDHSRIAIYALDGPRGRLAGELRGAFRRPEGIAVHAEGRIYATGSSTGNIEVFINGASRGSAGGLSSPHGIAIAADGMVWVADANNDRLVVMSPELEVTRVLEGAPYDFRGPRYLGFDDSGRLYVADKNSNRVKVLAPDGALLRVLGDGDSGPGPGHFDRPEGVAIHGADAWFSDTYNDRVVRYRIIE